MRSVLLTHKQIYASKHIVWWQNRHTCTWENPYLFIFTESHRWKRKWMFNVSIELNWNFLLRDIFLYLPCNRQSFCHWVMCHTHTNQHFFRVYLRKKGHILLPFISLLTHIVMLVHRVEHVSFSIFCTFIVPFPTIFTFFLFRSLFTLEKEIFYFI